MFALRTVVPKVKVTRFGTTQTFDIKNDTDVYKQSLDDVQQMLRQIAADDTAGQIALGNNPSRVIIDNHEASGRYVVRAQKKIEVLFGTKLPREAMVAIEAALLEGINAGTDAKENKYRPPTGALKDLDYWRWTLLSGGKEKVLLGPEDIDNFQFSDRLILKPQIAYATAVNNVVANRGTVAYKTKRGSATMGFLGYAAQKVKRNSRFKNLIIYAARDPKWSIPGEKSTQGTGFIVIRAGRAKGYRSPF